MFVLKKKYFILIENINDINLNNIKKNNKLIVIYRNNKIQENIYELIKFRKKCKLKQIKFFVANKIDLAFALKADGIYLSSRNRNFKPLHLIRLNMEIIGSAHNIKEINLKIIQGCKYILLSRLFKVSYKPNMSYLGIHKFNNYYSFFKKIIPLGGINLFNLNKLKLIKSDGLAIMTEAKKKPAILRRLF